MDEDEVFEIYDYISATEWENLVARLEEIIDHWQLGGCYSSVSVAKKLSKHWQAKAVWHQKVATVRLEDLHYNITYKWIEMEDDESSRVTDKIVKSDDVPFCVGSADLINRNDWCNWISEPPVTNDKNLCPPLDWWPHRACLLLTPASDSDALTTESRRNLIVSAISVAALNSRCFLPIWAYAGNSQHVQWFGICQNEQIRSNFSSAQLQSAPKQLRTLSGLIHVFREKLGCAISEPIRCCVRLHYYLDKIPETSFSQCDSRFADFTIHDSKDVLRACHSHSLSCFLPFGAQQDPVEDLELVCSWPEQQEDMIIDFDNHTDLDPITAPYWILRVAFCSRLSCLLNDLLNNFLALATHEYSYLCQTLLNNSLTSAKPESSDAREALKRLTGSEPNLLPNADLSNRLTRIGSSFSSQNLNPIIELNKENCLINYTFGNNADINDVMHIEKIDVTDNIKGLDNNLPEPEYKLSNKENKRIPGKAFKTRVSEANLQPIFDFKLLAFVKDQLNNSKLAPLDGLLCRFAICLLHCLSITTKNRHGQCIAQLWMKFCDQLKDIWQEAKAPLSGVGDIADRPDLSTCLLQQKLQMLNYCIGIKLNREKQGKIVSKDEYAKFSESVNTSSDELFFDCAETEENLKEMEPRGRLKPVPPGNITLLNDSTKLIYVPLTQELGPLCEDDLEAHQDQLVRIGSSQIGSALHSTQLISDMSSFKAANPGSVLEDFVRWYSPADWLADEGQLSRRMCDSGVEGEENLWHRCWNDAAIIPAKNQRRLFDDTTQAEKLLLWMRRLRLNELVNLLTPAVFAVALKFIASEIGDVYCNKDVTFKRFFEHALSSYKSACWENPTNIYKPFLEISNIVYDIEWRIARARVLRSRLGNEFTVEQVQEMLDIGWTPVLGGAHSQLGNQIKTLFRGDLCQSSPFAEKEMVLSCLCARPNANSRLSPQSLYVSIGTDLMTMACAVSSDLIC